MNFPRARPDASARAAIVVGVAASFVTAVGEPSTQPAGTVIYQDPAAGTSAQQTSVITITVAKPAGA